MATGHAYTDGEIAFIRTLAAAGATAATIAIKSSSKFGWPATRNQILGLCWRRGIDLTKPEVRKQQRKAMARKHAAPVIRKRGGAITAGIMPGVTSLNGRRTAPEPFRPSMLDATPALDGVTLLDLAHDQCRWPTGDPADLATFRYCGHPALTERPYCDRHTRRARGIGTSAERHSNSILVSKLGY